MRGMSAISSQCLQVCEASSRGWVLAGPVPAGDRHVALSIVCCGDVTRCGAFPLTYKLPLTSLRQQLNLRYVLRNTAFEHADGCNGAGT